jgi:hypothetical protein
MVYQLLCTKTTFQNEKSLLTLSFHTIHRTTPIFNHKELIELTECQIAKAQYIIINHLNISEKPTPLHQYVNWEALMWKIT